MVATYTYTTLQSWMYITCPATGEDIFPNQAEGNNIMVAVENAFISRTGLAITTSDAQHVQLCQWLTELEYRKWSNVRHAAADSHSTPGGSAAFTNRGLTFTWAQFDELVLKIKGGSVATPNTAAMVDADSGNELPTF